METLQLKVQKQNEKFTKWIQQKKVQLKTDQQKLINPKNREEKQRLKELSVLKVVLMKTMPSTVIENWMSLDEVAWEWENGKFTVEFPILDGLGRA